MNLVRGTNNIFGKKAIFYENCRYFFFNKKFQKKYNFEIIYPTVLNFTDKFNNLGELSDIINKEMFVFKDKKNRNICLSPEHTINVINNYKDYKTTVNACYFAKCFRYQRPQNNVKREFIQLGCEWMNIQEEKRQTIIEIFFKILNNFIKYIYKIYNIKNPKKIIFNYNIINEEYIKIVKQEINKTNINLCNLCNKRKIKNFIRILDCKNCSNKIKIKTNQLNFKISLNNNYFLILYNNKLVRGIDYYDNLIFELSSINSKKSFLSGGFYKLLNKNNFGFAMGLERFYNYIKYYNKDNNNI